MDEQSEIPKDYVDALAARHFDLVERLGRGQSGQVFKATQRSLQRPVAIKFFDNPLSIGNEQLRMRFVRESKLLAKISSSHIPYVITDGVIASKPSIPYFIMQYLPGRRLEERIKRRSISEYDAIQITRQVLEALAAAHREKVIHRDVSRLNVMEHDGRCYLIDFALGGPLRSMDPDATSLTQSGEHFGHYEYAAPEQRADAKLTDERTDIYSVGVLLFEMLSGHTRVDVDNLKRDLPKVRPALREIIERACAASPDHRYTSAGDFSATLLGVMPQPRLTRPDAAIAFCPNVMCDHADWTERGYYQGPRVVNTTDNHCDECGFELVYECRGCGTPFNKKPFCGNCGAKFFEIPVCKKCNSWLERVDMNQDTLQHGCGKCRRAAEAAASGNSVHISELDDDIPF